MKTNEQEFLKNITSGDLTRVDELLRENPSLIHAKTERGVSVLMLAVYHGQQKVVDFLIARVPELNVHEAAASGRLDRVKSAWMDHPVSLEVFSADGFTPLALAAFFGHKEVVKWLLEHGVDPNIPAQNAMRVMPLHSAAAHRNPAVAVAISRHLLEHGAQVNVSQQAGWTPLHEAAASGNVDLLRLLLSYGADPNARSEDGRTPIQMAEARNHRLAVEILRQNVADRSTSA